MQKENDMQKQVQNREKVQKGPLNGRTQSRELLYPEEARRRLFELQDLKYKAYHTRLTPYLPPDVVIGVRTPALRKLSRELWRSYDVSPFLADLPHRHYEENNLHGFFIEQFKDYESCIRELNAFLPYVDNWATCDQMTPKVLGKYKQELLKEIYVWMKSEEIYTVRFAIKMLMLHFLDDDFRPEYAEMVAAVPSKEYYVNMMQAWYFATALAMQYDAILPYIENHVLDPWTHNKAIQKAVESYRVTVEQKNHLKELKRS